MTSKDLREGPGVVVAGADGIDRDLCDGLRTLAIPKEVIDDA